MESFKVAKKRKKNFNEIAKLQRTGISISIIEYQEQLGVLSAVGWCTRGLHGVFAKPLEGSLRVIARDIRRSSWPV